MWRTAQPEKAKVYVLGTNDSSISPTVIKPEEGTLREKPE